MQFLFCQILAEVFQDLLANKDDYLRALRGLLREIVRATRYDISFPIFCLGLMQERQEARFTEMEPAFKVVLLKFGICKMLSDKLCTSVLNSVCYLLDMYISVFVGEWVMELDCDMMASLLLIITSHFLYI